MQAASGSSSEGSLLFASNSEASDGSLLSDSDDSADSEEMPSKPFKGSSADEDASEEIQADVRDEAGLSSYLSSDGSDIEAKQAAVAGCSKRGTQGVCHLEEGHCQNLSPRFSLTSEAQVLQLLAWQPHASPEAWHASLAAT